MGKFVLEKEIGKEIEKEIAAVLDRAEQEGKRLLEDARVRREQKVRQAAERLDQEMAARRRRAVSRAELEGRNALLALRRQEVDRVMAEAGEALKKMEREEPERFAELLWTFYGAGRRALPPGRVVVRIGGDVGSLRRRLEEEKDVEVREERELDGVVVESADGRVRCDYSLTALLAGIREEREAEIEEILFGEEG